MTGDPHAGRMAGGVAPITGGIGAATAQRFADNGLFGRGPSRRRSPIRSCSSRTPSSFVTGATLMIDGVRSIL